MSKVTVAQAEGLVSESRAQIYRDINSGKVSAELNNKGHKVIDVSELQRVYGQLKCPGDGVNISDETAETSPSIQVRADETENASKVVSLLESQVESLVSQLRESTEREKQLLKLLSVEQERSRLLMLPSSRRSFWGWIRQFWLPKARQIENREV